jgi:hypothetical protein
LSRATSCPATGDNHRDEDHGRQREEPDGSNGQQDDADQQPRGEPGVAKPVRSGEEAGELARINLDELVVTSIVIAAGTAKAAANHSPVPFMMIT